MMILLFAAPATAHPHVFVTATVQFVGDGKDKLNLVRTGWVFDEMFSSSLLMDFDANANNKLEPAELTEIGQTVLGSAKDYNFFTFLKDAGRPVALTAPSNFRVLFENGHLVLLTEMAVVKPLKLTRANLTLSIYDPSFYVSFDVGSDEHALLTDMPKGCRSSISSDTPTDGASAWLNQVAGLSKSQTIPADGINYAELLSTKVNVACP